MIKLHSFIIPFILAIPTAATGQDISEKANTFISTLSPELRSKTQFTFTDSERLNWHYIPKDREGPNFHDLDEKQKNALFSLLRESLSEQGYQKLTGILELERILQRVENRSTNDSYRDPLNYHVSIFGTPAPDKKWGWRLEGHHASLNFIIVNNKIVSSTPSFFGANPAIVRDGKEKGMKVLKQEIDLGFGLIGSFTEAQLKQAQISTRAPYNIITENDRKAGSLKPEGIKYASMNENQKKIFFQLMDAYLKNYSPVFYSGLMEKIKASGIDNLSFAWAGGLNPGTEHYYRIQGPTLLIEYNNTQNDGNHIHSVVRDLTNDFAEDVLR